MSTTRVAARVLAVCFTPTTHLEAAYKGPVLFWNNQHLIKATGIPDSIETILLSVRGLPSGRDSWFQKEAGKRTNRVSVEALDGVTDLECRLEQLFKGNSNGAAAISTSTAELLRKVDLVQSRMDGLKETINTILTVVGTELVEIRSVVERISVEQNTTAERLRGLEEDMKLANELKAVLGRHQKI